MAKSWYKCKNCSKNVWVDSGNKSIACPSCGGIASYCKECNK